MKQVRLLGGYVHFSYGYYGETLFPLHPEDTLASFTGIVLDGEVGAGTILVGAVVMNWGFAFGFSLEGSLYLPGEEEQ